MAIFFALIVFYFLSPEKIDRLLSESHEVYKNQLKEFRVEFGGSYKIPQKKFYLFGMGNRNKYLFFNGMLKDLFSGRVIYHWNNDSSVIIPNEYTVVIFDHSGKNMRITEDETGVRIYSKGKPDLLEGTSDPIRLPEFTGNKYSEILKVLHQEILINIVNSNPLPNLLVYNLPWRRDAAIMSMCLQKTGNLNLIRPWVYSITDPYDHNNGRARGQPESEIDNLGETLYLVSLFDDKDYPLVSRILDELQNYRVMDGQDVFIRGRTDFQEVPVYQTKWLIFGLNKLGIDNHYSIPIIPDNYSSLFWWDFKECHVEGEGWVNDNYPYIEWARDHFYGWKNGLISSREYPLTWEKEGCEADYKRMAFIDSAYTRQHLAVPHSWHAAEIFLYLTDQSLNYNN